MADESLCMVAADRSSSGKVDGNLENRVNNVESFIVEVISNLKANRRRSYCEELVKYVSSELTGFEEATCNNIFDKIVNENKLINKKHAKKYTFSLPTTNIKTGCGKKNPVIADLQGEIMALKEFVLSEVCLLNKEDKKDVSVGNSNSSDAQNEVANERLREKLEKENNFLREDFNKYY